MSVERITVRWNPYRNAYVVDRPSWDGGVVVPAESFDEARAEVEQLRKDLHDARRDRDKAYSEVERLRATRSATSRARVRQRPPRRTRDGRA